MRDDMLIVFGVCMIVVYHFRVWLGNLGGRYGGFGGGARVISLSWRWGYALLYSDARNQIPGTAINT
jgi:hypothetical protein